LKTKIIYISGGEVFDRNDIKNAFDEIKKTLNWDSDMVLFGVPVDEESVGANNYSPIDVSESESTDDIGTNQQSATCLGEAKRRRISNQQSDPDTPQHVVSESEVVDAFTSDPPAPVKKTRKRKQQTVVGANIIRPVDTSEVGAFPSLASLAGNDKCAQTDISESESSIAVETNRKPVAPQRSEGGSTILGIIRPVVDATNSATDSYGFETIADENASKSEIRNPSRRSEAKTDQKSEIIITEIDAPDGMMVSVEESTKTIEDIFRELGAMKEDKPVDLSVYDGTDSDAVADDAAIAALAREFADQNDVLETDEPAPKSGKISKIKNILPFKKIKKGDGSMLGDLFGWAGIAANDEDDRFQIPDFFGTR